MENTKILFISEEITPYLPETEMSRISRYLTPGDTGKGQRDQNIYAAFWKH